MPVTAFSETLTERPSREGSGDACWMKGRYLG